MSLSLYDVCVPSYLQTLSAVEKLLIKGEQFCQDNNIDTGEFLKVRLRDNMFPFSFQIISIAHHSLGAIKGIQAGVFGPPEVKSELSYAELCLLITDAKSALEALPKDEVNKLSGRAMKFKMGGLELPFSVENFILSFSLPNFYFHATTAYGILRMKGVEIGKTDFLGQMRISS